MISNSKKMKFILLLSINEQLLEILQKNPAKLQKSTEKLQYSSIIWKMDEVPSMLMEEEASYPGFGFGKLKKSFCKNQCQINNAL